MINQASSLSRRLTTTHQHFGITLFLGLAVGLARFLQWNEWLSSGIAVLLWVIGIVGAHVLFLFDSQIHSAASRSLPLGEKTADPSVNSPAPEEHSPLRRGPVLLLMPILGIFILSSTRSPLGLGFFWGVLSIYWWDLREFFTPSGQERIARLYFEEFAPQNPLVRWLVMGFLILGVAFTVGMLLMRGAR